MLCTENSKSKYDNDNFPQMKTKKTRQLIFPSLYPGGAVITRRPSNRTVQEGQGAEFACEGRASPKNVSVKWFKDGVAVHANADLVRIAFIPRAIPKEFHIRTI